PSHATDAWTSGSAQPNQKVPSSTQHKVHDNGGSDIRDNSKENPATLKPIDLSKFLSQNSTRINSSSSGDDKINQEFASLSEPSFTAPLTSKQLENDQRYGGGDSLNESRTFQNYSDKDPHKVSYIYDDVYNDSPDHNTAAVNDEHTENDVFLNNDENENVPLIAGGVSEQSSYFHRKDLQGNFDRSIAGDYDQDEKVTSVLDQVKARLKSRSQGQSVSDKTQTLAPPNIGTLTPNVSDKSSLNSAYQLQVQPSASQHRTERRGSDRYRIVREQILGGTGYFPESPVEAQEEQKNRQLQLVQHQKEQEQLPKKRVSKIPIPVWRSRKHLRHSTNSGDIDRRSDDHSVYENLRRSSKPKVSSLSAKFLEFRNDLDKEEELFKNATVRRNSSFSHSSESSGQNSERHADLRFLGTSKQLEPAESFEDHSDDFYDGDSNQREPQTDSQTTTDKVELEKYKPISDSKQFGDEINRTTAFLPLDLDDDKEPLRDSQRTSPETAPAHENEFTETKNFQDYERGISLEEESDLDKNIRTEESDKSLPASLYEQLQNKDAPPAQFDSSFVKGSYSVQRDGPDSGQRGQDGVDQTDSNEESQASIKPPTPVIRKRKSAIVSHHAGQEKECSRAALPEEHLALPISGFHDIARAEASVVDLKQTSTGERSRKSGRSLGITLSHPEDHIEKETDIIEEADEAEDIVGIDEKRNGFDAEKNQPIDIEDTKPSSKANPEDTSEFWKRLIAEPLPDAGNSKLTIPLRRPLRSSVPVFGNYPKASPSGSSAEGEDPAGSLYRRRHSDVSNRPKMEQLFSSLLDDLDQASQSESNPSDLDLSDGEDLLAQTFDSNTKDSSDDANSNRVSPFSREKESTVKNEDEEASKTFVGKSDKSHLIIHNTDSDEIKTNNSNETISTENKNNKLGKVTVNGAVEDIERQDGSKQDKRNRLSDWSQSPGVATVEDDHDISPTEDSSTGVDMETSPGTSLQRQSKQMPASSSTRPGAMSTVPVTDTVDGIHANTQEHSKAQTYVSNDTNFVINNNTSDFSNNNLDLGNNYSQSKPVPERESRNNTDSNMNTLSMEKGNTLAETLTSSSTLTLTPCDKNVKNQHQNPPAVTTIKASKHNTKLVGKRTFDVNEDDDGSVTYQASSEELGQNRTVTVRTRRLRTPSDATEELRDTIVERKYRVQRPAEISQKLSEMEASVPEKPKGSEDGKNRVSQKGENADPFSHVVIEERDVVRTKKRLTSRGSNYYSRSMVTTRVRKDGQGAPQTVEHDVVVESEAKSVSKGHSWGNRATTHVTTMADDEDENPDKIVDDLSKAIDSKAGPPQRAINPAEQDTRDDAAADTKGKNSVEASLSSSQGSQDRASYTESRTSSMEAKVGMDLSKVSSGYGSGPGSEEDGSPKKSETTHISASPEETTPKPTEGPPEVTQVLKDVLLCEGRQLSMECAFSSTHLEKVSWFKDDAELADDTETAVCRYDADTGKATFIVTRATIFDTALYACVGRNEAGEARTSCRVVVKRRPEKPPVFEKELGDVTVTEGHSIILTCTLVEAETVAWYKDGIVQRNSSDFKQTFDGRCARLEIGEVFLDDVGMYACVAKNEAGESRSSCKLSVDACGLETTVVPMFLTKMSNKVVNNGDTLHLECDVIGTPEPNITWSKDGEELSPQLTFSSSYDGRLATLELHEMRMEDAGVYRCVASNPAGRVSMDAAVTVQVKKQVPYFTSTPEEMTTQVGRSVTLKCEVRGVPKPVVFWRLNGQLVGDLARCIQSYSGGIARLEVLGAALSDGGQYECVARNDVGQSACSCSLTVVDPKAQRQAESPREEQALSAPPKEIIVRRRTFKKLSEQRPADVISAVLQRAATSPRGVQRAQSFSPQSVFGQESSSSSSSPSTSAREDKPKSINSINAEEDTSTAAEFSAPATGNSRPVEADVHAKLESTQRAAVSHKPAAERRSFDEDVYSDSSGKNRSSLPTSPDTPTGVMVSPRVEALRLSEQGTPVQVLNKPKATNLGRSASMHTVRDKSYSSHKTDVRSSSSSHSRAVWPPPKTGDSGSNEKCVQRETTNINPAHVENNAEVDFLGRIPGYRSVSPLLVKLPEGKESDTMSSSSGYEDNSVQQSSHIIDKLAKKPFSEPATTSLSTTPQSSSISSSSMLPPSSSSLSPSSSSAVAATASTSLPETMAEPTKLPATSDSGFKERAQTSTAATSPPPSSKSSVEKPEPPSSFSSQSSPPTSSKSSVSSSNGSIHTDKDSPSQHDSKLQQQQQKSKAEPSKVGKTLSPRVSELRLQFLKKDEEASRGNTKVGGSGGIRRWHSLPPQEFKPKVMKTILSIVLNIENRRSVQHSYSCCLADGKAAAAAVADFCNGASWRLLGV
ncbi:muscle m-line assembly protein unc-89, partial [Plakobranchus ocellatus]